MEARMEQLALALRRGAIALFLLAFAGPALADAGFRNWVHQFRAVALGNGVSPKTYDRAFRNVASPDPEVLEKARNQPEFRSPAWDYFDNRVNEAAVARGREMAQKYRRWLDRIESRFGVDRHILLAIWSMESNYGEILANERAMRNVIRSLATLAYADRRRAQYARQQLIAALKILQSGEIDERHLT